MGTGHPGADEPRRSSQAFMANAAETEGSWGLQPVRVGGLGEDEAEKDCMAAARRCVKLYLRIAHAMGRVHDPARLGAAAEVIRTKPWDSMADLSPVACGLSVQHVLAAMDHLLRRIGYCCVTYSETDRQQMLPPLEYVHHLYFVHVMDSPSNSKPLEQLRQAVGAATQYLGPEVDESTSWQSYFREEVLHHQTLMYIKVRCVVMCSCVHNCLTAKLDHSSCVNDTYLRRCVNNTSMVWAVWNA